MPSNRQRKLDAVVARLQLQYGPRAIRTLAPALRSGASAGEAAPAAEPIARLPTTFPALDDALGGGLPAGQITELLGAATSGKATLAAKALAAAQQKPKSLVAWLDLDRTCDPDYLHRCGLALDRLLVLLDEHGRVLAADEAAARAGVLPGLSERQAAAHCPAAALLPAAHSGRRRNASWTGPSVSPTAGSRTAWGAISVLAQRVGERCGHRPRGIIRGQRRRDT